MVNVLWFFTKVFFEAFLVGCGLRILLSAIFKFGMTFRGLFFSGFIFGLIITLMKYYVISTTVIP